MLTPMLTLDDLATLPARLLRLEHRQDQLERRVRAHEQVADEEVDTATALKLTGIRSRTTLLEERQRPGTLLRYRKHGRSASYSRQSCIDYRLSRELRPHQPAMWAAAS